MIDRYTLDGQTSPDAMVRYVQPEERVVKKDN
jgi:hypothetical protein